jgi:hypothetical protein
MTFNYFVVEVQGEKGGWFEVSRYQTDLCYTSGRHLNGKVLAARDIAEEDRAIFSSKHGYGRPARIVIKGPANDRS